LEATKNDLVAEIPGLEVLLLETDVTSEVSVSAAIGAAAAKFGRIDVAVNNAGVSGAFSSTATTPWPEWERVYNVNIHGVWRCQKHELQLMSSQEARELKYACRNQSAKARSVG